MDDAEALRAIEEAFRGSPRPEHFTDYRHCCECAEHDELLRSRDLDTLGIADVGNPGWDPICYITDEGFRYYLPALARLALAAPLEAGGWYMPQLLFHLGYQGQGNRRNPHVFRCRQVGRKPEIPGSHGDGSLGDFACHRALCHPFWAYAAYPAIVASSAGK